MPLPDVRVWLSRPFHDERELRARLRDAPGPALARAVERCLRARIVDDRNAETARVLLQVAVERGAEELVARLARDATLGWWARSAAAGALFEARRLDAGHGAAALEALVFRLLAAGEHELADDVASVLATLGAGGDVIARISRWRAACGVPAGDLAAAVAVRAWVEPPCRRGGCVVVLELSPRRPGDPVRSYAVLTVGTADRAITTRWQRLVLGGDGLEDWVRRGGAVAAPFAEVGAWLRTIADGFDGHPELAALLDTFAAPVPPPITAGPLPSPEQALALLQRPEAFAELAIDDGPDAPSWSDDTTLRDDAALAARMLARWYTWADDAAAAGAYTALAEDAERRWARSRLARAMVRNGAADTPAVPGIAPGAPDALRVPRPSDERLRAWLDELVRAWREAPEAQRCMPRVRRFGWAAVVAMYGANVFGVTPIGWSPVTLRTLLLTVLPAFATVEGDEAADVLAELRAFFAWMRRAWGHAPADALLAAIDPPMERTLAEHLDDRRRWTDAKARRLATRPRGSQADAPADA